ncbi:O-fucosyltransferase family protein [Geobacter argillaceus]|uniref:Glycosyl transferase family 11 n=1 Tax=Geobacter argillaceus TaxID=345631 RepID=A0A562VNI0_9BACT|nr:hypothetical protein [Geobacter argillaceus]TWJ19287.1 hypothetical protein JN12_01978 [Geobacter argillaceus]
MNQLFIDEFVGISNRLEALPLAFAIRRAYGHDIVLDWRELDSFSIDETRRGTVRIMARLGALRIRDCDEALFASLKGKKIILRSLNGPAELLDPIYLEVARKIHLCPALTEDIRATFDRVAGRPIVGVHIRHGDFTVTNEEMYDVRGTQWPAVPVWWYEKTMAAVATRQKDVCFFLSCTGDPAAFSTLHRNFDVITLGIDSPYAYKGPDHDSRVNPVADLFALACCPVILATPISCYSHWAANVLGKPTDCIVPRPGATPAAPLKGLLQLHGKRLPRWQAAGREGVDITTISDVFESVDLSRSADTSWL